MSATLDFDAMVRGMIAQGVPKDRAERVAREELERDARIRVYDPTREPIIVPPAIPGMGLLAGDAVTVARRRWPLDLTIPHPPRTKKNSTTLGVKQSVQYRRYARQVKHWAGEHAAQYGFPLPAIDYAVAVTFYVDNERCDTVGLCQGLFDALQGAGVVPDDKYLRRIQRADWVHDPLLPRAVITLTPL